MPQAEEVRQKEDNSKRMIMFAISIIIMLVFSPISDAISIARGEKAPDFSLNTVDGASLTPEDYQGQTIIFIFWRTDQKRSLQAIVDARDILKKYEAKGVDVISVIEESDSINDAKKAFEDNGITFPLAIDKDRKAYGDFGVRVYPTTVLIDKDGILQYDIPSHPLTYKNKLEGYVRRLIGEINEEQLKQVLSPKKEEKDPATLEADRKYNLAMRFVQMQMMDQAIAAARKSVEAKPDLIRSRILLGFLYLNNDDADNALAEFDKALELDPDSNDAKTGKGGAYLLKGEADNAIKILKEATVANPYAQMTYYELGRAYELKGDKDESIKMYKKALEKIVRKKILPSSISKCQ